MNNDLEELVSAMRKNKRQAKQLNPNSIVVSVECAEKNIRRAYELGKKYKSTNS